MSIAKHHAEWLSLLEISGPFLNLNTLSRVFPQGVDMIEPARASELRAAYEEWSVEAPHDPRFHRQWVLYVLQTLLGWDDTVLAKEQAIPEPFHYTAVEHGGERIRPTFILHERRQPNMVRAMVSVYTPDVALEKSLPRALWAASPAARMLALLHATGVQIGLVTNGEQWMLVSASKTGMAGFISWYADLWNEERLTLRAFVSLLESRRFFGVADEDTLEAMLDQSADDAQEVTDQLGMQVREAVEILVRALDRCDQDMRGDLLDGVSESRLYEAALTVMMRLVFLLSAEERGLFLLGDELYDQNYAISTLRAQLREAADRMGEEVLERRSDAWSRLLATFRLVYHGASHQDLKLPAYGGSLFDPGRFPFLEGGQTGTPPHVDNRTVLHLLDALQILQTRGEARRLSFRALDIEQIGHVYEGLLDHEARRAEGVMLGFDGKLEPEISLDALEAQSDITKYLKEMTGKGETAIKNALKKAPDGERLRRLFEHSCRSDRALFDRVMPYLNLLRDDEFGSPLVIHPGSVYVTSGTERRATGTHYTPRSLTEPIVEHTLEPLVYRGVAEGLPPEAWELKAPREILSLKVCDMAMGSGAFLVQACRYLAARLLEAWERRIEAEDTPIPRLTVDGEPPTGALTEILIPDDPNERMTLALRLIADRCLYGVDKNPLAVEMAKLSLWLTTLAKGRPFTFLDHALKCGDSLLGVSLRQLRLWNLDPDADDVPLFRIRLGERIDEIVGLRLQLEGFTVNSVRDQQEKARLHREAEMRLNDLRTAADLLAASYLVEEVKDKQRSDLRLRLLNAVMNGEDLTAADREKLSPVFERHRPFHWELEFPEVFISPLTLNPSPSVRSSRGEGLENAPSSPSLLPAAGEGSQQKLPSPQAKRDGEGPGVRSSSPRHADGEGPGVRTGFDAVVGNPPFQGGQHLTGLFGTPYRDYLVNHIAGGQKGSADLCAYFFLRAYRLLRAGGAFGLIATNTIAQGDTREVGLVQLDRAGAAIYRAANNLTWPGAAAVVVDVVHVYKGAYRGARCLDDQPVAFITPLLDDIAVDGHYLPRRLLANAGKSFQGSIVLGMGFVLEPEAAQALIARDPRNRDVLFPYLNGEDLNSHPEQQPSRWVINFFDWPEERAMQYPDCYAIVRETVKPERTRLKPNGEFALRDPLPQKWWIYAEKRPALYRTIAPLRRVLVVALTSKYVSFSFVDAKWIYAHACGVIAFQESCFLSILQSTIHDSWTRQLASTLETRLRYTPADVFETFPFPPDEALASLEGIGEAYHEARRQIMRARWEGLTDTYNRFHNPDERSADIQHLRELHRQMDEAVAAAYGWDDLDLAHDFYETAQGVRYTISEAARREVLRRLLALNFARYEEEQRLSVGGDVRKGRKKPSPPAPLPQGAGESASSGEWEERLEGPPLREDGEGRGGEDNDPNAPPPEQQSLWDDGEPKQKRLL
jgi:hypothetical protein